MKPDDFTTPFHNRPYPHDVVSRFSQSILAHLPRSLAGYYPIGLLAVKNIGADQRGPCPFSTVQRLRRATKWCFMCLKA
jgi:hypothetical protein